jgi:cytochrome P450
MTDEELVDLVMEILLAGTDTTAKTLSYTSFELASNPNIQKRLYDELLQAFPDPKEDRLGVLRAGDLPFLDCVIKETLRVYPIVPGLLERVLPQDMIVHGVTLPKGTVCGISAWERHNDETVFPEPEKWRPERYGCVLSYLLIEC